MKKLKVYKNPDFRFVEVQLENSIGAFQGTNGVTNPDTESDPNEEVEGFDAPIFRPGIWDEE